MSSQPTPSKKSKPTDDGVVGVRSKGIGSPLDKPRFSLRFKLALIIALLATIPPVIIGLRLIDVNAVTVEELNRELQLAVLDDISRTIEQDFVDAQDGLTSLGRILTDATSPEDQIITLALSLVEASEALDHVGIFDHEGALIDTIREEEAPRITLPEKLPFELRQGAIRRNADTGSAEHLIDGVRVLLVVPIRTQQENVTGFAASLVSLRRIQQRIEMLSVARFGGAAESLFVVDGSLRIVAHPDRRRLLSAASRESILLGNTDQLLRGELSQTGEFTTSNGISMLGSATSLRGRPWAVVVQVPQSIAYSSLTRMRRIVVETIVVTIVLALFAGLLFARKITSPLARLTTYARALASRRFEESIEVSTRDELALLANAMSSAAKDLKSSEENLREELAIRADLGRYLPSELVEEIVRREREMALGGERRQITVLFADVVAFTPLVEAREPEEVVMILNELFTILTDIVFRHGGTVDKFVGDSVMAIWGAPTAHEDHAARALSAAEDMYRWLETGNATWKERFDITLRLAVGVHSGEAVVGNIGSERRMEYTAIGDAVNVAARLETIARPQQILVSQTTRDAAGNDFEYLDAGEHVLAGKTERMQLYEVKLD